MLKQVLGEPWQNADRIDPDARRFDAEARVKVDVMEHRWTDALRDYGVRDITMPATPHTVWKAIQDAKMGAATPRAIGRAKRGRMR